MGCSGKTRSPQPHFPKARGLVARTAAGQERGGAGVPNPLSGSFKSLVSTRLVSTYLPSHRRQQGVEAGGQEDPSSKGVAEGKDPPGAVSFLVVALHHLDREEGPNQHEDADAQQTQHFDHHDLHPAPGEGPAVVVRAGTWADGTDRPQGNDAAGRKRTERFPCVSTGRAELHLAPQTPTQTHGGSTSQTPAGRNRQRNTKPQQTAAQTLVLAPANRHGLGLGGCICKPTQ